MARRISRPDVVLGMVTVVAGPVLGIVIADLGAGPRLGIGIAVAAVWAVHALIAWRFWRRRPRRGILHQDSRIYLLATILGIALPAVALLAWWSGG